jgi:hypothetical protein
VNKAKQEMDGHIGQIRDAAQRRENELTERLRKAESENLQLNERIAQLQQANTKNILKPRPEESLADATVTAATPGAGEVTINRGMRDKIILGMSFAVYADATAIKPGPGGEYPMGKASVEVVNVGETTSTCRVTRETRGNPIVRGDVVANAIYDPNKTYTFLVFGNFDSNGDGMATPHEADSVRAIINEWGGKTTDELSGSVDFLVLGQRPVVPPPPNSGAPPAVVTEYLRIDQLAKRYDDLTRQAASTSVPILNENRLYTLIGRRPGVR